MIAVWTGTNHSILSRTWLHSAVLLGPALWPLSRHGRHRGSRDWLSPKSFSIEKRRMSPIDIHGQMPGGTDYYGIVSGNAMLCFFAVLLFFIRLPTILRKSDPEKRRQTCAKALPDLRAQF